jgi:outer membrane protein
VRALAILAVVLAWAPPSVAAEQAPGPATPPAMPPAMPPPSASASSAPGAAPLTLAAARHRVLSEHPRILAARLRAEAARQDIRIARSAFLPEVDGAATAAWARNGPDRIGAGGLNDPTVYSRTAVGGVASQLITDFGRSDNLLAAAEDAARGDDAQAARIQVEVLLALDRAFLLRQQDDEVLTVARETVATRQTVVDRVAALTRNQLRSELDLGFAQVSLGQAQLLVAQAQTSVAEQDSVLKGLLGITEAPPLTLAPAPAPAPLPASVEALVQRAEDHSPLIQALVAERAQALHISRAEARLALPTLRAIGSAGYMPTHDFRLNDNWAAAAVNLTVPLFTGFADQARARRARLDADAFMQSLSDALTTLRTQVLVTRQRLDYELQAIALNARLAEQAHHAYALADARYRAGSSSIVELSQAQLAATEADIDAVRAGYDARLEQAELDYLSGYPDVPAP